MGRATKVKVRCGILDGAALDCARQEFWALFAGTRRRIAGDEPFHWCRGGAGLDDCRACRARPSSCQVVVMVVDTSGLWPIPAVLLDTSCIPVVSSLCAGVGAGSLVTRTRPATGCPHGVCLETTLVLADGRGDAVGGCFQQYRWTPAEYRW